MAVYKTYATKDSFMRGVPESGKTVNFGADTQVEHGVDYLGATKSTLDRSIGNFDVSPLAGRTINSAKLVRQLSFAFGSALVRVRRCTRPADWVESEVTWNNYKSGTPWTAAGGDFDDVGPPSVDFTEPGMSGLHEITGMAPFVTDALNNRNGIVSLIMRLADENPGSDAVWGWRSKEYGGHDVWRLVIDHSGAPIGARRERGFLRGVQRGVMRGV